MHDESGYEEIADATMYVAGLALSSAEDTRAELEELRTRLSEMDERLMRFWRPFAGRA